MEKDNPQKESILILGAGLMQKPSILAAKEEGLFVYSVDANPSAAAVPLCDAFKKIDLKEKEAIYEFAKFLKNERRTTAPETILNYIKYCCEAYLFYQVKREDIQGKQVLASNEKYYIADHGIREAVFGGNTRDINLVLENIVYLELLRRGYEITVGRAGDKEIDFVCNRHGEKLYVQVAYLLASEETVNREFGVYDSIHDNFPKYVVSLDEFDMSRNGIKHQNIRDFLLAEEWN